MTGAALQVDAATGTGSGTSGALVFRTAPASAGTLSVDASSSSNTANTATSLTWSHTVGAGANLLMVGFSYNAGTISSVTYNGVAMTQKSTVTNGTSITAMYYLVSPATGANNVVITLGSANSIIGGATSFIGADTVTPLGPAVTTGLSNTNTITSGAVTSAAGEIVFDSLGVALDVTASPGAGQTQGWFIHNPTAGDSGGGSTKAGASSVTTSWTGLGTTADATLIDVSVKAASGASANTLAERMRILAAGNVCIATASCTKTLGVSGTIAASGTITASTTPDLAETIAAAADVEAADVVMADPHNTERVVKASGAYTGAAVGVISDGTSSFMINAYGGNNGELTGKPLVLAGRVPVKITDEGGPVIPGDYLTTSSTPGYAMKATHAGPTIGKALGYSSGAQGTVLALVNVSYADPASEMVNLQTTTMTLQQKVDALTAQVSSGSFGALNITGSATVNSLAVAGQVTAGSLSVAGAADVASLTVSGNAIVGGDITVNGHLVTGGPVPTVVAGTAACANPTVSIAGTDTAGTVAITAGANACAASGILAAVTFSKAFAGSPRIILTPTGPDAPKLQYGVGSTSSTGFELESQTAAHPGRTYTYNYFVIQ
ncbi:MAG: hypothetical protein NVS3B29_08400 [Candidatus Saccharimonadales bacterium]